LGGVPDTTAWQQFFEMQSEQQLDRISGWARYVSRPGKGRDYRNGVLRAGFLTRFGTIRLCIARTRGKAFSAGEAETFFGVGPTRSGC